MGEHRLRRLYRKQRQDIAKNRIDAECLEMINRIDRIESKIHCIKGTTTYDKEKITDSIGDIKRFKDHSDNEHYNYNSEYVWNRKNFTLSILLDPKWSYITVNHITIKPKNDVTEQAYFDFLTWLNSCLPLVISSVEYTLDIFTDSPRRLYNLIRRFMVVPYTRDSLTFGGQTYGKTYQGVKNRVTHFNDKDKAYERGKDSDKAKNEGESTKGWTRELIDRVRLEHTETNKKVFKKHGIIFLKDLLDNPHFDDIVGNLWRFKRFRKGFKKGDFPKYYEEFKEKDANGNSGSMMLEVLAGREKVSNVRDCLAPLENLVPLEKLLFKASKRRIFGGCITMGKVYLNHNF